MLDKKVIDTAKTKVYLFSYDLGAKLSSARKLEAIHLPDKLPLQVALELDKKEVETFGENAMNLARLDRELESVKNDYVGRIESALLDANTQVIAYVEEGRANEIPGQLPAWNAAFLRKLKTLEADFEKQAEDVARQFLVKLKIDKKALKNFNWKERFSIAIPATGLIIGIALMATAPFSGPLAIPGIYGSIKGGAKLISNVATIYEEVEATIKRGEERAGKLAQSYGLVKTKLGKTGVAGEAAKRAVNSLLGVDGGKFALNAINEVRNTLKTAEGKRLQVGDHAGKLGKAMTAALRKLPEAEAEFLKYAEKNKAGKDERARIDANWKKEEKRLEDALNKLITSATALEVRAEAAKAGIAKIEAFAKTLDPLTEGKAWEAFDYVLKAVEVGLAFADPKPIEIAKGLTPTAGLLAIEEAAARVFAGTKLEKAKVKVPADQV